jgi:uncharacterized protein YaiI (UPF0178 family)
MGGLRLWVDADACPAAVKDVLYRAAERVKVELTLVANKSIRVPRSPHIRMVRVGAGFDVADRWIAERVTPGDLVVTADIPLAADVIRAGALALNPRGTLYTEENIDDYLAQRDLLDQLRSEGAVSGGPPTMNSRDVQRFANALDRFLARQRR